MGPLSAAAGAGALAAAVFFGLWQMERATSAGLRGEVDGLKISLVTETKRADGEKRNNDRMFEMATSAQDRASALDGKIDQIRASSQATIAELEALKATELNDAIEEPFARGNAASDRRHRRVCELLAKTDGVCAGSIDTTGDGTDNQERSGDLQPD